MTPYTMSSTATNIQTFHSSSTASSSPVAAAATSAAMRSPYSGRSSPLSANTARPPKLRMDTLVSPPNTTTTATNTSSHLSSTGRAAAVQQTQHSSSIRSAGPSSAGNVVVGAHRARHPPLSPHPPTTNTSAGMVAPLSASYDRSAADAFSAMFSASSAGNSHIHQQPTSASGAPRSAHFGSFSQGLSAGGGLVSAGGPLTPSNIAYNAPPMTPRTKQQFDYNRAYSRSRNSDDSDSHDSSSSKHASSTTNHASVGSNHGVQSQPDQATHTPVRKGDGGDGKKVNLYKTELCRSWEETGSCRYANKCQFAHSASELRHVDRHPKYKTEMCKTFWDKGTCPYGKRCCFIHKENTGGMLKLAKVNASGSTSIAVAAVNHAAGMAGLGSAPMSSAGLDSASFILRTPMEDTSVIPSPLSLTDPRFSTAQESSSSSAAVAAIGKHTLPNLSTRGFHSDFMQPMSAPLVSTSMPVTSAAIAAVVASTNGNMPVSASTSPFLVDQIHDPFFLSTRQMHPTGGSSRGTSPGSQQSPAGNNSQVSVAQSAASVAAAQAASVSNSQHLNSLHSVVEEEDALLPDILADLSLTPKNRKRAQTTSAQTSPIISSPLFAHSFPGNGAPGLTSVLPYGGNSPSGLPHQVPHGITTPSGMIGSGMQPGFTSSDFFGSGSNELLLGTPIGAQSLVSTPGSNVGPFSGFPLSAGSQSLGSAGVVPTTHTNTHPGLMYQQMSPPKKNLNFSQSSSSHMGNL